MNKLYKQTSGGDIQTWEIKVTGNKITTVYGLLEGKKQTTVDIIKEGKNKGKVNETSPEEQAVIKAQQLYDKKLKSGYTDDLKLAQKKSNVLDAIKPMLAHPINDKLKYVTFPAICQPKLDGMRCIIIKKGNDVKLYSRTQKLIETVPHINEEVKRLFKDDIILDGELYNHTLKDDFNKIMSLIKRDEIHPDAEKIIQFHWYDTIKKGGWLARNNVITLHSNIIKEVEHDVILSEKEMYDHQREYIEDGYEGLMYRSMEGEYEHKRSNNLLKVKTFKDDEYEIVGVTEGVGKLMGKAGSFECITKEGKTFGVKMTGTNDSLEEYFVNFAKYKGKMLTVKYQELTPDGIPRFGVGKAIRLEE